MYITASSVTSETPISRRQESPSARTNPAKGTVTPIRLPMRCLLGTASGLSRIAELAIVPQIIAPAEISCKRPGARFARAHRQAIVLRPRMNGLDRDEHRDVGLVLAGGGAPGGYEGGGLSVVLPKLQERGEDP